MKRPVRFGSYRAFGENAWRSCLATVPDTTEIHTHTIKTVLKRPVRFGSYRAFGPNARRSRFAPRHGSGHHYTHNLIWKPQLRVLCHWSQCWHNQCGLVRIGLSVRTLGARASSWFRTPRKYIHTQQICRPHPVPTSLVASGLKQYRNDQGFRSEPARFGSSLGFQIGRDATTHNLISKPHFRVLRHWSLWD